MSLNRVFLLGRLGIDPELRYTPSQTAVCTLRLATSERRKSAEGEWAEHTEWHSVVTFGKTAENCSNFLQKGRQVFVEGRIQTRKWQDQEGKDRYSTEIIANTVQFVGGRGDTQENERSNYQPSSGAPTSGSNNSNNSNNKPQIGETISFDDDDIPF